MASRQVANKELTGEEPRPEQEVLENKHKHRQHNHEQIEGHGRAPQIPLPRLGPSVGVQNLHVRMALFGDFECVPINMFFVLFCAAALAKRHHAKRRSRSEARHLVETFQRQEEENDDEKLRYGNGDSGKSSRRRKSHRSDSSQNVSVERGPEGEAPRVESSKARQELKKIEAAKAKQETKKAEALKEMKKAEAVREMKKAEARNKQGVRETPVEAEFVDDEPPGVEMDLGEGFPMDPLDDPLAVDMHEYR